MLEKDKWFYFTHGKESSSIEELREVISEMRGAEFSHHVSSDKNDFASWVENVFKEKELSKRLKSALTKDKILKVLDTYLKGDIEPDELSGGYHKKLDDETKTIEEVKQISKSEKELSQKEIKKAVEEARRVLERAELKSVVRKYPLRDHSKFIVKEFIYGFFLGLIFGLIMLGILIKIG